MAFCSCNFGDEDEVVATVRWRSISHPDVVVLDGVCVYCLEDVEAGVIAARDGWEFAGRE